MNSRVILVVDNPRRDLGGLSLLAYRLAKLGLEVHLVPMYDQELHVFSINPDFILMNYCRSVNANKIKLYKRAGFMVGILDTEGGILRNVYDELVVGVARSQVLPLIDVYYFWGEKQLLAFSEYCGEQKIENVRLAQTGSPRYDFFHDDFKGFNYNPAVCSGYVLLIASFPLCNPGFSSLEEEASNMAGVLNYALVDVQEMQQMAKARMDAYIKLIGLLVKKYPEQIFVLRPHPFEDHEVYREVFGGCDNVRVDGSGEIYSVLHEARLVIQINSSTAVEAAMVGKPVLQPEFLQDEVNRVEQVEQCSYLAADENHFYELFDCLLNGAMNEAVARRKDEVSINVERIIRGYFTAIDGKSSLRAARMIIDDIGSEGCERSSFKCFMIFLFYYVRTFVRNVYYFAFNHARAVAVTEKSLNRGTTDRIFKFMNCNVGHVDVNSYYSMIGSFKSSRVVVQPIKENDG